MKNPDVLSAHAGSFSPTIGLGGTRWTLGGRNCRWTTRQKLFAEIETYREH